MFLLHLFLYIALTAGIIYGFIFKKSTIFTLFFLSFICLYDWILIHLSYTLPSNIVLLLKSLQEILASLVCICICYNVYISNKLPINKIDKIALLFLFISIVGIANSFTSGNDIKSIIQGLRLYITPVLIPFLFYKYGLFKQISLRYLNAYIKILICVLLCFSIIQVYSYNGDLSSLWFYNFYNSEPNNPIDFASYNFVRDGNLRATAFFVSSIHLAIAFAFLCMYCFTMKLRGYFFWCILALIGIELTQTRMGYFLLIIVLGIICTSKISHNNSYLIIPFAAVIVTFISLMFEITNDESAIGRLKQYTTFYSDFSIKGRGIGDYFSLVYYDSFYLSILTAFGICALMYIYGYLRYMSILHKYVLNLPNGDDKKFLSYVVYICCTALYLFAFHYVAGSFPFNFLFTLVFIGLSLCSNYNKRIKNDVYITSGIV